MSVLHPHLLACSLLALVPCLTWGGERPVTGPKPMEPMILTPENLPEGLGEEIINDSCSSCHDVTPLTSDQRSVQQQISLVDQMTSLGTQLPNQYYPRLTFLFNNLSVSAPPAE